MKLKLTMMAVAALALATGLTCAYSASPTPTPSLEQRVGNLQKRLQAVESIPGVALMLKNSTQTNATPQPTPAAQADAPLELVKWSYEFKRGEYEFQNRHHFDYTLNNRTNKAIKLVEGGITFTDLLGEKLVAIRLDKDHKYLPGLPSSVDGEWKVNQFRESSELRMMDIAHDDVKVTLLIDKVVFSDNTVWSANDSQK
jgi:hypothetical protein